MRHMVNTTDLWKNHMDSSLYGSLFRVDRIPESEKSPIIVEALQHGGIRPNETWFSLQAERL